jgi:multiple sugar transport system permease protein
MTIAALRPELVNAPRTRRLRILLLMGGALLLLGGAFMLGIAANLRDLTLLLRNIAPVLIMAGCILIVQGVVVQRFSGIRRLAWFLVVPSVVFIALVVIFPTIYALGISTVQWDVQVPDQRFVGVDNYVTLFETARFWGALRNTVVIAVGAVALQFVLGIGLAVLFVQEFPGRAFFLSILILPLMVAPVVAGQTWRMLWDPRFGAVNDLLSRLSGQLVTIPWMSRPEYAISGLIITDVWQWTPFVFLIALAGFLAVNSELYEAARVDGASPLAIFWRITLPVVRPVLLVALLLRLFDALKIFDIVHILTQGGPGSTTETFSYYLYLNGISFGRFGYSAAGAILFMILIVIASSFLIRRIGET